MLTKESGRKLFEIGERLYGAPPAEGPKRKFPHFAEMRECLPYKNIAEVLNFLDLFVHDQLPEWLSMTSPLLEATSYCVPYSEILSPTKPAVLRRTAPKTMVCHDYKGGYIEDRFIDYNWEAEKNYIFTQWSLVDMFVYFSHYFVTVPPPCWINAGHAHGVLVLGTLITEGESGRDVWNDILSSSERWEWFAGTLALINQEHKFDGYLLNVENTLAPDQVPKLVEFIKYLRLVLPEDAKVIWYDSVTKDGKLIWQNALNAHNVVFFNVCDGIYLNYNYQPWRLEKSRELAGPRALDVYVGIDVFGRGCPGFGFFSSDAASMAREYGLSIAIFAPGWTEEAISGNPLLNNVIFWSAMNGQLYLHGTKDTESSLVFLIGGKKDGEKNFNNLTGVSSDDYFLWRGKKGLVQLIFLPPLSSSSILHRPLVNLQDAVVTYKELDLSKYYADFPKPIASVNETKDSDLNKTITIDTRGRILSSRIPFILLETEGTNFTVTVIAKGFGSVRLYFTVEESAKVSDNFFDLPLTNSWTTSSFSKNCDGTLLELGFEVDRNVTAHIQLVTLAQK